MNGASLMSTKEYPVDHQSTAFAGTSAEAAPAAATTASAATTIPSAATATRSTTTTTSASTTISSAATATPSAATTTVSAAETEGTLAAMVPIHSATPATAAATTKPRPIFHDCIVDHDSDIVYMTETWLFSSDSVVINALTLKRSNFITCIERRGGGVGVLYKSSYHLCSSTPLSRYVIRRIRTNTARCQCGICYTNHDR